MDKNKRKTKKKKQKKEYSERAKKVMKNLIPLGKRDKEEQARIRSLGGKATGRKRRTTKLFREIAEDLFSLKAPEKLEDKIKELFPDVDARYLNTKVAILFQVLAKAMSGDMEAFKLMRETIGEMPTNKHEIITSNTNVNVDLNEVKKVVEELNGVLDEKDIK